MTAYRTLDYQAPYLPMNWINVSGISAHLYMKLSDEHPRLTISILCYTHLQTPMECFNKESLGTDNCSVDLEYIYVPYYHEGNTLALLSRNTHIHLWSDQCSNPLSTECGLCCHPNRH